MGMFDRVEFEAPCPTCGAMLTDWQSKSGPCQMKTLKPWQVMRFYSNCDCGTWVEYEQESVHELPPPPEPPDWRDWFAREVTPPNQSAEEVP